MKKYNILFIIILFVGFTIAVIANNRSAAQVITKSFKAKQLEWAERYMGVMEKDSILVNLYRLSKAENYDSVVGMCKGLIRESPDTKDYYSFCASAFYNQGKKDSAIAYIKKYTDRKKNGTYEIDDVLMFSWFPCFYKIGSDSSMYLYALNAYKANYLKQGQLKKDLGLHLIDLYYRDQLSRAMLTLSLPYCNDTNDVRIAKEKFHKTSTKDAIAFLNLYKTHPGYITTKEVGTVAKFQSLLIWHADSLSRKAILFPLLKRAMVQGEITPDEYVRQLLQDYQRRGAYKQAKELQDSLCKVYGCEGTTQYTGN